MIKREEVLIILDEILPTICINQIWNLTRFERIKHVGTNGVGVAGQRFLEAYLKRLNIPFELPPGRIGPFDIKIAGLETELKTASLDTMGKFQFNHVRPYRKYQEVLFLGIAPTEVYIRMLAKEYVLKNLRPVNMEKGADNDLKITLRTRELKPIERFSKMLQKRLWFYPVALGNRRVRLVIKSPFRGITKEWIESLIPLHG